MEALKVSGLKKSFKISKRIVRAVDDVSFSIGENEIFGLLGMNGAGKSTTIKICTGLLDADDGSVSVYGHDIRRERAAAKSALNVSPQETAVAPLLTVRENLTFMSRIYGADKSTARKNADDVMERLRLADRADDRAKKLSGGLMRRLSIGMAIITSPRLVFLDEPTLGLDIVSRRELWRLIKDVAQTASVVLTTHYLEEAEALCGNIAVMAHGKLAAIGSAQALKEESGADNFEDAFLRLSGEANGEL